MINLFKKHKTQSSMDKEIKTTIELFRYNYNELEMAYVVIGIKEAALFYLYGRQNILKSEMDGVNQAIKNLEK